MMGKRKRFFAKIDALIVGPPTKSLRQFFDEYVNEMDDLDSDTEAAIWQDIIDDQDALAAHIRNVKDEISKRRARKSRLRGLKSVKSEYYRSE